MPVQPVDKVWVNGELVGWQDATIPIVSHVVQYGTGVFEGIRAYETTKGTAVFRLHDDAVHAVGNHDPLCGANVLSRGIVGTRGETPVVVSPMHKQAYDLRTGVCLDAPEAAVPVYAARVRGGVVELAIPS